ncbi:hypothetical protein Nepgr_027027 [Nepenthes gracilis]|uniref:ZF-HD dimerization-type domain-containing protein n=1 Tax=Nepenthes gracilis TaxID=150966 RepID=A0AAD3Y2Q0_NEPGR|nr:hypothetical protein Nepgr_027027 [Nepenthes gracilis]
MEEAGNGGLTFTSTASHQRHRNSHPHRQHDRHIDRRRNAQGARKYQDSLDPIINPCQKPINSRSKSNPKRHDAPTSTIAIATATATANRIRHGECQRNHAAHLGGHVVDGCGEFMAGGEEGTPEYFKCAACDCHRNFHRREAYGETPPPTTSYHLLYNSSKPITQNHINIISAAQPTSMLLQPPQPQIHPGVSPFGSTNPLPVFQPPMTVAFGGGRTGAPAESSSEDLNVFRSHVEGQPSEAHGAPKKRFRTKFTAEQKHNMMQFAEKLGWRIQKQNDLEIDKFCEEARVKRQVFRVWMHNNKQAMKRKQPSVD